MIEEENEGFGLDMYNPKSDDSQACNALRSCIIKDMEKITKVCGQQNNCALLNICLLK